MEAVYTALKDVGFPIFVAVWLLLDRKATIHELRKSVDANTKATNELITYLRQI